MYRMPGFGRFLFAISVMVFGIQQIVYIGFVAGLELLPKWIPGHAFFAYLTGAALIVAGLSILIGKRARFAASLLAIFFFFCILLLHLPRMAAILHNGSERTVAFETVAMCGGALLLAGTLPPEPGFQTWNNAAEMAVAPGLLLVAVSMAVFGVDHLMFAGFVATLIPSWIPLHLFWAYFTGIAFVAAGLAIAIQKWGRLAAALLGLMFLLWFVLVHAPRVAAHPKNGNEWNSAFVALAMSGVAFIASGAMKNLSGPLGGKRI